jgi:hypothetical protein
MIDNLRSVRMMGRRRIEKGRERRRGGRAGDLESGGLQVKDVIPYILGAVLLGPAALLPLLSSSSASHLNLNVFILVQLLELH